MRKGFGNWKKVVGIMTALTLALGMTNMSVFADEIDVGGQEGEQEETEVPDPLNGFAEIAPNQDGGVLFYHTDKDDGDACAVYSEDNTFEMGDINNTKQNYYGYSLFIKNLGDEAMVTTGSVTNTGSSTGGEMTGVYAYNEGGKVDVTTGAVKAENEDTAWVVGVYADGRNGNSTNMNIEGDVVGVGGKYATGINIVQSGEGETKVSVKNGDVTGKASRDASGASIRAMSGGRATLVVKGGDIRSNIFGLVLSADDADGTGINVVADGTVSGGVYVTGGASAENINLTVWKIEPSVKGAYISDNEEDFLNVEDGHLMAAPDESNLGGAANGNLGATTPTGNNLANVYYIIKVEQPEAGGKLTATKADGSALDKSEGYDAAKSGEKVYLKVDLQDGYEILGAFNGEGQEETLLKDADGNYYVEVTQAGGVYLSVKLNKTAEDKETVDDDDTDEEVTPATTDTGSKEAPASKNLADSPKTGDETNVMLMIILMGLSLTGAVSVIEMKRRQER